MKFNIAFWACIILTNIYALAPHTIVNYGLAGGYFVLGLVNFYFDNKFDK